MIFYQATEISVALQLESMMLDRFLEVCAISRPYEWKLDNFPYAFEIRFPDTLRHTCDSLPLEPLCMLHVHCKSVLLFKHVMLCNSPENLTKLSVEWAYIRLKGFVRSLSDISAKWENVGPQIFPGRLWEVVHYYWQAI